MSENAIWSRCGSCKKPILVETNYFACDISTCRKAAYCSLECFSAHTPVMRHKDAWAVEKRAPAVVQEISKDRVANIVRPQPSANAPKDILIVASKLKDYIRAKSGMNTSQNTLDRLSDIVRLHSDRAIERARSEGRKTVMDRDFIL